MIRCTICGAAIKPWYEMCHECYNPALTSVIPERVITKEFVQNMGIVVGNKKRKSRTITAEQKLQNLDKIEVLCSI